MGVLIQEQARRKGLTPSQLGRLAGKKARGVPKGFIFKRDRKCNTRCALWSRCPAKYLSNAGPIGDKDYEGRCALADMSQKTKTYIKKSMGGEEELEDLIMENMMETLMSSKSQKLNIQTRIKLNDQFIKIKESFYGKKSKVDANITGEGDPWGISRMIEYIQEQNLNKTKNKKSKE